MTKIRPSLVARSNATLTHPSFAEATLRFARSPDDLLVAACGKVQRNHTVMRRLARLRVVAVSPFDDGPGIWRGFEPHREVIGAAGLEMVKTDPEAMTRGGGRCGQPPRPEPDDDGLLRRLILDGQAHQIIPFVLVCVCRTC